MIVLGKEFFLSEEKMRAFEKALLETKNIEQAHKQTEKE